ncbi:cobalamin biosynthesis protein [Streptomyces sp. NPDC050560]|uniref:cobalamin biosynthesis protein n=1 Tax=Streptomyces sp. NPDC050560 TaxID=3365630 RepID=UPI003792A16C
MVVDASRARTPGVAYRGLTVGVGASGAADAAEVYGLVTRALDAAGLAHARVAALATVRARGGHPGIVGAAARLGVPVVAHPPEVLAAVPVAHRSARAAAAVGTPSVAEAAALASGGRLLVGRRASAHATCAIAEASG